MGIELGEMVMLGRKKCGGTIAMLFYRKGGWYKRQVIVFSILVFSLSPVSLQKRLCNQILARIRRVGGGSSCIRKRCKGNG